jgi:Tfp pilus assembly protein PilF
MTKEEMNELIEDATLDFTLGDNELAVSKLRKVLVVDDQIFDAWHALTEIYYAEKNFEEAKVCAESALAIDPNDIHINTSLSRIWLALGSKEQAEHFGAQARMLGWKEELKNPQEDDVI